MKFIVLFAVFAIAMARPFPDDDIRFFIPSVSAYRTPAFVDKYQAPIQKFEKFETKFETPFFSVDDDVNGFVTPLKEVKPIVEVEEPTFSFKQPVEYKVQETKFVDTGFRSDSLPVFKKTYKQPVVYKQHFFYDD